jgi:hypothetical protein
VIRAAVLLVVVCAAPAIAAPEKTLIDILAGYGCTLAPDSRAAALAEGYTNLTIDTRIAEMVTAGQAVRQGDYVVLDPETCTMRLPVITPPLMLDDARVADIVARAPFDGAAGADVCFLTNAAHIFAPAYGADNAAAMQTYAQFVAAHVIAGELRLYGTDLLSTPLGGRVLAGDCAGGPDETAIRASHAALSAHLDAWVRATAADTVCDGSAFDGGDVMLAQRLQAEADPSATVNAWMGMEYLFIAMAAGWVDGMTWEDRGSPRPPMCHYP